MMGHTHEEQWHAKREEYRKNVANYYKAKRIARMIQCEIGIAKLPTVDPWSFKSTSMREMAMFLRRSLITLEQDKKGLGLHPSKRDVALDHESHIMRMNKYFRNGHTPTMRREIMSIEEAAEMIDKMLSPDWKEEFVFPKFYKQLVAKKHIDVVFGSAQFMVNKDKTIGSITTGPLRVITAREIKAEWLAEESIRAFKVVVIPNDTNKTVYNCVVGYAAISKLTNGIKPAFGRDVASAVSLCKRRVRVEVLKRMEV